jgi:hypothetical protein
MSSEFAKKCIFNLLITFVSFEFMSAFLLVVKNVCFSMDYVRYVCLFICFSVGLLAVIRML